MSDSKPQTFLSHWPGGIPPRVWADRIIRQEADIAQVPEQLRSFVQEHVDNYQARQAP